MWHVPGTNDLFIIMGISAAIEFLSSLRSSLQLIVIKNRIKTTTKKPKWIKLKFTQNIYTRTLKQAYKETSIQKYNNNNNNKTTNHMSFLTGSF